MKIILSLLCCAVFFASATDPPRFFHCSDGSIQLTEKEIGRCSNLQNLALSHEDYASKITSELGNPEISETFFIKFPMTSLKLLLKGIFGETPVGDLRKTMDGLILANFDLFASVLGLMDVCSGYGDELEFWLAFLYKFCIFGKVILNPKSESTLEIKNIAYIHKSLEAVNLGHLFLGKFTLDECLLSLGLKGVNSYNWSKDNSSSEGVFLQQKYLPSISYLDISETYKRSSYVSVQARSPFKTVYNTKEQCLGNAFFNSLIGLKELRYEFDGSSSQDSEYFGHICNIIQKNRLQLALIDIKLSTNENVIQFFKSISELELRELSIRGGHSAYNVSPVPLNAVGDFKFPSVEILNLSYFDFSKEVVNWQTFLGKFTKLREVKIQSNVFIFGNFEDLVNNLPFKLAKLSFLDNQLIGSSLLKPAFYQKVSPEIIGSFENQKLKLEATISKLDWNKFLYLNDLRINSLGLLFSKQVLSNHTFTNQCSVEELLSANLELSKFSNLKSLDVEKHNLDWGKIIGLEKLKVLRLSKNIEHFTGHTYTIPSQSEGFVEGLKQKTLLGSSNPVNFIELCSKLEELTVEGFSFSLEPTLLQNLPTLGLTKLVLKSGNFDDSIMRFLGRCPNLKYLSITSITSECKFTVGDLVLQELEYLEIGLYIPIEVIKSFAPNLRALVLHKFSFGKSEGAAFKELIKDGGFGNLSHLSFKDYPRNPIFLIDLINGIAQLPRLCRLVLPDFFDAQPIKQDLDDARLYLYEKMPLLEEVAFE